MIFFEMETKFEYAPNFDWKGRSDWLANYYNFELYAFYKATFVTGYCRGMISLYWWLEIFQSSRDHWKTSRDLGIWEMESE